LKSATQGIRCFCIYTLFINLAHLFAETRGEYDDNVSFIFNVLADLAKFARKKEMIELEKAIWEAHYTARTEIAQRRDGSNYKTVMEAVFPEYKELTLSDNSK
jgi:hypothetical protein